MKLSDLVLDFIKKIGVKSVFTVSGGGCIHLIDSLGKSGLEYVCVHHEQSATMAAEGYTRTTDQIGACIVTTGPGGTNAITGVLGCWLDSIPSIIISGQVSLSQISEGSNCRQIGDQEFDIISTVKSMTKYAVMIKDKNKILYHLQKAYYLATSGRPGPVWIDIPLDIQASQIDVDTLDQFEIPIDGSKLSESNIEKFITLIQSARKPLIVTGNGIRLSHSVDLLDIFLNKTKIPIITSIHSGIDCIDNSYDYYAGRIGILGQITANQLVQESDLLICLGTRLPVKMTGYDTANFSPLSKKIIVDIDQNEINKHKFHFDLKIVDDLKNFLSNINNKDINLDISEWQKQVKTTRSKQVYFQDKHLNCKDYLSYYYFISKASNYFNQIPIVTSNGSAHVITLQNYNINKNQRVFTNVGCASMGYGLPAAIGASFAVDKSEVICIEGDGSIMMNLQELQTVKTHNLPIKIFIINNDGYISIKITQESFFNGKEYASGKESGVEIPNFQKISDAFGIRYFSIKNNNEIDDQMQEIMDYKGPCIVELFTHPREKHEPKVVAKGIDKNGKIIPGSLTDMFISDKF
jgi:acetolactate synthase-1/2/3 large subunit